MPGIDPMNATSSGVKLTYDDYVLFPDDGLRHEIIDGEHCVTPSPILRHQSISGNLFLPVAIWLKTHPIGRIFYAPCDVIFSHFDIVVPDLLYMSHERAAEVMLAKHVRGAPELVIEIGSPGTRKRDETTKRRLYERAGVSEYWVVDPEPDVLRIYRREGEVFGRAVELTREAGEILTTPLLPGLEVPLADIFGE
jgi:Uma2 family endonuclease